MGRSRIDATRTLAAVVAGALLVLLALTLAGVGSAGGPPSAGAATGERVRAVAKAASPAVVVVSSEGRTGSGILMDRKGHVLTNAHVVGAAREADVAIGGRLVTAYVRGVEPSVDVAVLALPEAPDGIVPLEPDRSGEVRLGDPVVAIGSPFGLPGSVTTGIVSGLERQIEAPNGFAITGVIQTDAALNPGNSGGPLLDLSGRVIGVATQIATEGGRNEGIGFAVPAAVAWRVAGRIVATGSADLPYLGVAGQDAEDGILVQSVFRDGPAEGRIQVGDVLLAVNGIPVPDNAELARQLAFRVPGEEIDVLVRHVGAEETVQVTLGARPTDGP
jgi:putative serine protease PepD